MKKFIAILLSAVLLASMCTMFVSAAAADYAPQPLFISHYDNFEAEGAGAIFTVAYEQCAWWNHYAFTPIEGTNAFELTEISIGIGTGAGTALAIPEGGFVYAINKGNDYPALYAQDPVLYAWCAGMPDYVNDACDASIALVGGWEIGDKFVFDGIDLENKTVPTTTPDLDWYADGYVCTATVAPYVSYADTESVNAETGDYVYDVAWGYTFDIASVDGVIGGEDATLIVTGEKYLDCNPNWAITVLLNNTEIENLYEVASVTVTPGNATTVVIGEGQSALVVHSAASNPDEGYDNWQSKVAAIACQAGDKILVNETQTEAYVLMPGEKVVVDDGGSDEPVDPTLKEVFDEINAEPNADAAFDVVLEGPESYKAGDTVTITATIKNIADGGIAMVEFGLVYDPTQLELVAEFDEENALECVAAMPEGWENFSTLGDEEGSVIASALNANGNISEDGALKFTFTFKAKADASAETGAIVPHAAVAGAVHTDTDTLPLVGNGSYVVIAYNAGGQESGGQTGDATNAIVMVVLAIVAVVGSAVVVKTRR